MFPLSDTNTYGRFPFLTFIIIAINVGVFFIELTTPNGDQFVAQYALIPAQVNWSDPASLYPFITSQFLHGGWLHIIGNMLFLWVFGANVERRMGLLFVPFYLAAGVVGGIAQYFVDPTTTVASIGASGAIAGVLGAFLYFFPHHRIKTLIFIFVFFTLIELPAPILLLYWFIIQLFNGVTSITNSTDNGIAYFAHIGGFVFGWVLAHLWKKQDPVFDYKL